MVWRSKSLKISPISAEILKFYTTWLYMVNPEIGAGESVGSWGTNIVLRAPLCYDCDVYKNDGIGTLGQFRTNKIMYLSIKMKIL